MNNTVGHGSLSYLLIGRIQATRRNILSPGQKKAPGTHPHGREAEKYTDLGLYSANSLMAVLAREELLKNNVDHRAKQTR